MGSDYPFPLGEMEDGVTYVAGKLIEDSKEHTEEEKTQMLSKNALEWMGLSEESFLSDPSARVTAP